MLRAERICSRCSIHVSSCGGVVALAAPRQRPLPWPRHVGRISGLGVFGVDLARVPPDAERLVGDDLGARLAAQPRRAAEVVGMRVGDDDAVHPLERDAGGVRGG